MATNILDAKFFKQLTEMSSITATIKDIENQFKQFSNALDRLGEAFDNYKNSHLYSDVPKYEEVFEGLLVQRFLFTFECCYKTLQNIISYQGEIIYGHQEVLEKAYEYQLIDNEKIWLEMLKDRNIGIDLYDEPMAKAACKRIETYYPVLVEQHKKLLAKLETYNQQEKN